VGGGGDQKEIVAYTRELGLQDVVFFVEPIHDRSRIRAWYCRADLFLFPSTFDTNGLVVREAAACALPSVLVRGSCAAEDSTDGVTSFLIEENAQSMAAMLRRLLTEPECIRRVGEAAQQDLYLSWEDAVDNACRGYAAVIENYRSGRYPRHDTPTDEIIHRLTKAMEWVDQAELLRDLREPPRSSEELLALLRRRRDQLGQSFHRPDRFL
jgi:glycosyltransferase involved in cell wall biosynthesis